MIAGFFLDEPLRAYTERKMNDSLKGYTVRLEKLHFHPLGFSIDLINLVLVRNEEPDLPILSVPRWTASVHWHALLFGRLVNDHYIERPTIRITLTEVKQEAEDEVPVEERGWQDAVESIYPFKINQLKIVDANVTYLDEADPSRPLHFQNLNLRATNIRNVRSKDRHYPSDIFLEGTLFDSGRIRIDGHADFLDEPHMGITADLVMEQVPLGVLMPVTSRYNVQLNQGQVSGEGHVEYAPTIKFVNLKKLTIDGLRVDYIHAKETEEVEKARVKAAVETAKKINANQEARIRVDQIKIVHSEVGFVNQATKPEYRVFITDADIELDNYSNQLREGAALINFKGKFMGTGETDISGTFRPEHESPDVAFKVKIDNMQVRSMNNLMRAYADFDVVAGTISVYSEVDINDGKIQGYVKPLFKDLDIYDTRQDRRKAFFLKIREGFMDDMSSVLKNSPRKEVATKVDISGSTKDPHTDTLQVLLRLIQNAFFKAILPGFEHEVSSGKNGTEHG